MCRLNLDEGMARPITTAATRICPLAWPTVLWTLLRSNAVKALPRISNQKCRRLRAYGSLDIGRQRYHR